jgi:hypothetical protein
MEQFTGIMENNFVQGDSDSRRGIGLLFLSGKFCSEEWNVITGTR